MPKKYTKEHIKTLDPITHIRKLPHGYIEDNGIAGQYHILKELIDNALDEIENFDPIDGCLKTFIWFYKNRYLVLVEDNMRGIPHEKIKDVYTKDLTSGKFHDQAYEFTSGLFGKGAKVTLALSKIFRAITSRDNKTSDIVLNYENLDVEPKVYDEQYFQGTIVIYEPDNKIFRDISEFKTQGIELLKELFALISYFNSYKIYLYKINITNKKEFDTVYEYLFNRSVPELLELVEEEYESNWYPEFDSTTIQNNKQKYLQYYLGTKDLSKYESFTIEHQDKKLKFKLELILPKTIKALKLMDQLEPKTLVNNIVFKNFRDVHIRTTYLWLKELLASKLDKQDKKLKQYLLERYKLFIGFLGDFKFKGAKFTGLTKSNFNDLDFKDHYTKVLKNLDNKIKEQLAESLYKYYYKHLKEIYESSLYKKTRSDTKSLLSSLNYPNRFYDCEEHGPDSELFICEGTSAEASHIRDIKFQAIYSLSGKPINSVIDKRSIIKSLEKLSNNKIFEDIIKILNIKPNQDLSKLRFGKIMITTDADEHGQHIAGILVGNFYILNPRLLSEGHIYIVISPLFEVKIDDRYYLIRTKHELISTLAKHYYLNQFKVLLNNKFLNEEDSVLWITRIWNYGDILENLSKKLAIPENILEAIVFFGIDKINDIAKYLQATKYYIDQTTNTLYLTIDQFDYIIHIGNIEQIINTHISKFVKWFNDINIVLKTQDNQFIKYQFPYGYYLYLKELNKKITIRRLKGLGSMSPEERERYCVNPKTRTLYRITSIGDLNLLFGILGNESDIRKTLLVLKD